MEIRPNRRFPISLCVLLLSANPAAALLQDGSFEAATSGTTTSNSAWQLVANAPDGATPSAVFEDGLNMDDDPTLFALNLSGVTAGDDITVMVQMTGGMSALSNPQSAFVDNFTLIRRVPEPATALLFASGLAVSLARRRRWSQIPAS